MTARLKVTEKREFRGGQEFGDEVWDRMTRISALWVVKMGKNSVFTSVEDKNICSVAKPCELLI